MREDGIEKVAERRLFRDAFLGLREDVLRTAAGGLLRRKVVEYRAAAAVAPVDERGAVLLVRHYRHPVGRALWENPRRDHRGGRAGPPLYRELREETGYRAAELVPLSASTP